MKIFLGGMETIRYGGGGNGGNGGRLDGKEKIKMETGKRRKRGENGKEEEES